MSRRALLHGGFLFHGATLTTPWNRLCSSVSIHVAGRIVNADHSIMWTATVANWAPEAFENSWLSPSRNRTMPPCV